MPFKSDSQRKLCYLLKSKGQAGSWDCDEWSTETGKKKLPGHVEKQEEKKALKYTDKLPGGIGDNKKPSDFPKKDLEGMYEEEKIHTSDPDIAKELAIDHLTEDKDYYKDLEKLKKSKKAAMLKLARLWSLPAKISKLAEITTSPNRGAGDKEEGIVNFDSSEGIAHAVHKEPKKGPALSLTPVDSHPKPYLARKALIGATKKTYGNNPTGGSILNKMAADPSYPQQVYNNFANPIRSVRQFGSAFHDIANNIDDSNKSREMIYRQQSQLNKLNKDRAAPVTSSPAPAPNRNFDFSSIGQKLDPSIIGAPSNQAAAKPVNPISQLGSTLKQVGSAMGDRATGAIRKGAEDWVKAPGWTNPTEVYRRRNQALDTQKQLGKSVGDMAGAFKQTASGARAIGNAIPGMAKQSDAPSAAPKAVAPAAPAAGNSLGQAWQHRGAIAPVVVNAVQAGVGSDDAKARLDADANRFNWSALKDNATKAWNDPSTQKGVQDMYDLQAKHYEGRLGLLDKAKLGLQYGTTDPEKIRAGESARIKGDMGKWTAGLGSSMSKSPFGVAANYVGTGVNNYATNSEAKRMTAQTAMPYVDWMRANPWAKYMLGAGAGLLGGYALRNLFGDGGDGQQAQGNPIESAMAQGYQQQAMQQLPRNYGNMYGMRG